MRLFLTIAHSYLAVGAVLLSGLSNGSETTFQPTSWPWTYSEELHAELAALSNMTIIYNSTLLPAQPMLANFLDSVQLNLVYRLANATDDGGNSSSSNSPRSSRGASSLEESLPLAIHTDFQCFPNQGNETMPNAAIIPAQLLYVTLGMGPLFGSLAHHVLAEREHGFLLLQQLCLMSPWSYWSSLFTADSITLVFIPFAVSLVLQCIMDPCTFGGIGTGQYSMTIVLVVLYILSAAACMSATYLFTRIFRGHGERANAALFLTLLL